MSECTGRVSVAEAMAVVERLSELGLRAQEGGQSFLHFVLCTAADALEDNLQALSDLEGDNDE